VNAVREDPERKGLLFAATETAVWTSCDDGEHWDSLQLNLPHTSMRDLWIHDDDLIVATHGRSIWILDDISRLRQVTSAAPMHAVVLFRPADAYRVQRSTWTDTPVPPDEPLAENPPAGAVIDFFLPHDAGRPVMLEVLDSSERLVRASEATILPSRARKNSPANSFRSIGSKPPRVLAAQAGMHRWGVGPSLCGSRHHRARLPDLRGTACDTTGAGRSARAARTLPGTPDGRGPPLRGAAHCEDGSARTACQRRSRGSIAPRHAVSQAAERELPGTACGQIRTGAAEGSGARRRDGRSGSSLPGAAGRAVRSTDKKEDEEQQDRAASKILLPAVQGFIVALYADVTRGDAAPTAAQVNTTATLQQALTGLLRTWQQLQVDLPALNATPAGGETRPNPRGAPPPRDLNAADTD